MDTRLPLPPALAGLLELTDEALCADPRSAADALIVGSAVLRSARHTVAPASVRERGAAALFDIDDWSHALEGAEAGSVLSNGSVLDARRLTLRYGLYDAVLVGSATVTEEGLPGAIGPGWMWALETPLGFPALAADADPLAAAFDDARRALHTDGWRSSRATPALVVVTAGKVQALPAWLHAPALQRSDSWILTSVDGASRLLDLCRRAGRDAPFSADRLSEMLLPHSPPDAPSRIDLATVPCMLRDRLDVRIAAHDGGRRTLGAFAEAGALHQLDLTFVGAPPLSKTHPGAQTTLFDCGCGFAGLSVLRMLEHEEGAWVVQCRVDGALWR